MTAFILASEGATIVTGQNEVVTSITNLTVEPNPDVLAQNVSMGNSTFYYDNGCGWSTISLSALIQPLPPSSTDMFDHISIHVKEPSGTSVIAGTYQSLPDGSIYISYSNTFEVGKVNISLSFPGESFDNNSIYYLPSSSNWITLKVQPPPNLPAATSTPTPTANPSPSPSSTPSPTGPITANSWIQKASRPAEQLGMGATAVNGTIYIFGTNDYAYNPITDTLTKIAPMLTQRSAFAVATCGTRVYVIGGYTVNTDEPLAVNEAYDTATNTWATEAPMPTSRAEMMADSIGGEIYVIGGRTSDTVTTGVTEIYTPVNNSWTTGASMPYPVANAASAVVGNLIYVIGGEDDNLPPPSPLVNFNQIYNPAADNWNLGTPIPKATVLDGAAATTGVNAPIRIYVFGNIGGFLVGSNQSYAYDPVANSWVAAAPVPYECVEPAVAVVNDLVYVMEQTENIEQFTPIGYVAPMNVSATIAGGKTVSLTLVGNVTGSQMSNITIVADRHASETTVSFTVIGEDCTIGFSNITIPISAVPYGSKPTVYIDNQTAQNQGYTQDATNYYVWYTTQFSTHQISIVFNSQKSANSPIHDLFQINWLEVLYGAGIAIAAVILVVVALKLVIRGQGAPLGRTEVRSEKRSQQQLHRQSHPKRSRHLLVTSNQEQKNS